MRECEGPMDVTRREKFSSTCSDPPFPRRSLALRAVPVAAGVVGDGGAMSAAGALIEMPAKGGGKTARNGPQHFDNLSNKPVASSFDENSFRVSDEIGHPQRWAAPLLFRIQ